MLAFVATVVGKTFPGATFVALDGRVFAVDRANGAGGTCAIISS